MVFRTADIDLLVLKIFIKLMAKLKCKINFLTNAFIKFWKDICKKIRQIINITEYILRITKNQWNISDRGDLSLLLTNFTPDIKKVSLNNVTVITGSFLFNYANSDYHLCYIKIIIIVKQVCIIVLTSKNLIRGDICTLQYKKCRGSNEKRNPRAKRFGSPCVLRC